MSDVTDTVVGVSDIGSDMNTESTLSNINSNYIETQDTTVNNAAIISNSHDVTIQRLDVHIPFSNTSLVPSGQVFYHVDNWTGTEDQINGAPIIYLPPTVSGEHPIHANIEADIDAEVKRIGGYVVGNLSDTRVIDVGDGLGEPRVVAKANFTCEKVHNLVKDGKLSISTGFNANVTRDGYINGKIKFNHLLIFHRNQCNGTKCQSNDKGAYFNNISVQEANMEINNIIPRHTESFGFDYNGRWRKPQLIDFTDKTRLSDLSEDKRRDIAAHFAYSKTYPPTTFAELKLGHHNPKKIGLGEVNRNGVIAAMRVLAGAMGGVDMPEDEKRRAYEHLKEHRIAMGDDKDKIPSFDNILSGEIEMTDELKEIGLNEESKGIFKSFIEKMETLITKTEVQNVIVNSDAPDVPETKPEEIPMDTTEFDNLKADFDAKVAEFDNLKSELEAKNTEIETLKAKEIEFNNLKAEIEQKEKDAKWTEFKNKAEIPAAWLEDEPATRAEAEADPMAFMMKLTEFKNKTESIATKSEGLVEVGNSIEAKTLGKYNMTTGKWE